MNYQIILLFISFIGTFTRCKEQDQNLLVFDQVWSRVNEQYFDPNFNGVNWNEVKEQYRPKIEDCKNTEALLLQLNSMLYELNSSHTGVGLLSTLEHDASPYIFKKGEVGIDIRILENEIVVTRIKEHSPADGSTIKPGYVIDKIDQLTLEDIAEQVRYKPPFNIRNKKFHLTSEVLRRIYGTPGTNVTIEFRNENNEQQSVTLIRRKRTHGVSLSAGISEAYLESQSHYLSEDLAYLSFNAFQPNDMAEVLAHFEEVFHSKGLIIDLRGNDGGSVEGMKLLLGRFVSERKKYGVYSNRNEHNEDHIEPIGPIYQGKIALLIDEMSISGAENFAGIFKLFQLGKIFGTTTPGQMLWGNGYIINDEIALAVPVYKLNYTDGYNPENSGIKPDIHVRLSRNDLLNGKDSQLIKGIQYLNESLNK